MSDIQEARALPSEDLNLATVYPLPLGDGEPLPEWEAPSHRGNGRGRRPAAEPALRRVLEAILFATDRPVTVEQFLYAVPECDPSRIEEELQAMERSYRETGAGFILQRSAGGYSLQTDPDLHDYVHRFLIGKKRSRLSRAAMETLAIVAYRQPVTRGEMEEVRGVDCGQVLHTLLERNLVTIRGRSQALGRPLLYGTTAEFLHYFGINSLADLPSLEELRSMLVDDPLDDPEIREALEAQGLLEAEDLAGLEAADTTPPGDAPGDEGSPGAAEAPAQADPFEPEVAASQVTGSGFLPAAG